MFSIEEIFKWVKKNVSRRDIFILTALIIAYFATRLINLDKFPIFSDEGIYIRWAKVAWKDASRRFISLTDGRQPFQTWATIPFLKLFPENALFAGRLFSVATGFAGFIGIVSTLFYLFGKKSSYIGALLYIFTPYFLIYDRLALADSGVNAFFIWVFLFSIILAKKIRLDIALIFGLIAGMGLLVKSSARLFIGLSVFAPILFIHKIDKKTLLRVVNFVILFFAAAILSFAIYNVQRLSPFFHYIASKNQTFVMSFGDLIKDPLAVFPHNIKIIPKYIFWEMGFLSAFLGILGWLRLKNRDIRLFLYISIWIFVSYISIAALARVIFPRYLVFIGTLLTILAAYFINSIKSRNYVLLIGISLVLIFAYYNYTIIFNPSKLPFPPIDRGQYVEGVTAVWGAKDLMQFARKESQKQKVILIAEGNFGLIGDVLDVFKRQEDNIEIKGYWPLNIEDLEENQDLLKNNKVYIVFSHRSQFPPLWPIEYVSQYDKPGGKAAVYVYRLLEKKNY